MLLCDRRSCVRAHSRRKKRRKNVKTRTAAREGREPSGIQDYSLSWETSGQRASGGSSKRHTPRSLLQFYLSYHEKRITKTVQQPDSPFAERSSGNAAVLGEDFEKETDCVDPQGKMESPAHANEASKATQDSRHAIRRKNENGSQGDAETTGPRLSRPLGARAVKSAR